MKRYVLYVITCLYILNIGFIRSYAEESSENTLNNFAYEVIFPENQVNNNVGYFDLKMEAGTNQTIQLKLSNLSSENMTVDIAINSAKTNGNGIIEYGENQLKSDDSLQNDLKDQVTGPQDVTISPHSSKLVEYTISLPKEAFEGYLAGGIQLKPRDTNDKANKGQAVVINEFAYVVALLIHESDPTTLKPIVELNGMSLKRRDGVYVLNTSLSNIQPVFVEDMTTHITVRKKGTKEILIEKKQSDMRMAPNTLLNFPVELENTTIDSGDYIVEVQLTTKKGDNWQWKKEFTFSRLEAKQIQETNGSPKKNNMIKWLFIFLTLLLLISVCVYVRGKYFSNKSKRSRR